MDRYWSFYTFLVEWHAFELVLAKLLDTFSDEFNCSADGQRWIITGAKGNLFFVLHIMGSMMGTGMTRAVFIKTAKSEGFFGGLEKEDDIKQVSDVVDLSSAKVKDDIVKDTKKSQ